MDNDFKESTAMKRLFTWMMLLCYAVVLTGCTGDDTSAPADGDGGTPAESHEEGAPSHDEGGTEEGGTEEGGTEEGGTEEGGTEEGASENP
jgi:hypothetical protein